MKFFQKIRSFLFENTSTKQTIIKNTFWLLLAEFINKGSVFFITLLIAAKLGPEQFGVMSFVTTFVTFFIIFSDYGLTSLMVRDVSKNQSLFGSYLLNLSVLKFGLSILTFIIVAILTQSFIKLTTYDTLILTYLLYAILNNFSEFLRAFFRPSEQMQHEAFLKITQGLIFLGGVGAVVLMEPTLSNIFFAYVMTGIIGLGITVIYLLTHTRSVLFGIKLDRKILRDSLSVGTVFLLNSFFFQIYTISDQLMLGFYSMEFELGQYATAYQFSALLTLGFTLLIGVMNPRIIKSLVVPEHFRSIFKQFRNVLIGLLVIAAGIGVFFSEYVYLLMLPDEFSHGYISLQILLLSLMFSVLNIFYGTILQNMQQEKLCLAGVAFGGILNTCLNFYFIQYGAIGVAFTTFFTNIVVFILLTSFFHYAQKNYWKNHQ